MKIGRSLFTPAPGKTDFSGEDFRSIYFAADPRLDHSYFNGVHAANCAFDSTDISNVEMAEAQLDHCFLFGVNLSGTDFVGSRFRDVQFVDCNFAEGEWRDSSFVHCTFINCDFAHTTVNLCVFDRCSFCANSSKHFEQLSINYNTFLGCEVGYRIESEAVLSRNYALPAANKGRSVAVTGVGVTLEHVCLVSGYGDVDVETLATAIENELVDSRARRMRKLRMEFVVNVISQLSTHHKISAASLIYLESLFTNFARSVEGDADLRVAMSAMMTIRNAIFEATQTDEELVDSSANCIAIGVSYDDDLDVEDAENLAYLLTCAINDDEVRVKTQSVRRGSLLIEYIIEGSLQFSSALLAINFALSQTRKMVNHVGQLKKSLADVVAPPKPRRKTPRPQDKLPAIERHGGVAKKLEAAQKAVSKIGKGVTRLDRSASVRFDLDR